MHRRTVLVTGAGGLIGSRLIAALLRLGYDVAAVDRDSRRLDRLIRDSGTDRLRTFHVDITERVDVLGAVAATKPAALVHLAAIHVIPHCEAQPRRAVGVNIDGLINVLDAADRAQTEFVLFGSTADVYTPSAAPLAESDPARPSTVYGISKLLGERLVAEWAGRQPGRRATSVRIFNVYGTGDSNPHVIPDIVKGLRGRGEIRVGNIGARRDFIHVDDLIDILCHVLSSAEPPTLVNAGTGRATSVAEILGIIQRLVRRPLTWSSDLAKMRVNDRLHLRADTSRLRTSFPGFDPRDLETGLVDVLAAAGVQVVGPRRSRTSQG